MSGGLDKGNILGELTTLFPNFSRSIVEFFADGVDPERDLHTIFGVIVMLEYLVPELDAPAVVHEEDVRRLFGFIESMATCGDPSIVNVVEVTICELLGDDERRLLRSYELMGPQTRALSDRIEIYLGRADRYRSDR